MGVAQPHVLAAVSAHAGFLFLELRHARTVAQAIEEIGRLDVGAGLVGLGPGLVAAAGAVIDGLRPYVAPPGARVDVPSTPHHVLLRLVGDDPGDVLLAERTVLAALPSLRVADRVATFRHGASRDLTGYEDGTENPVGDDAVAVALRSGEGPGLDGSAVVAVQRWEHDLDAYDAMPIAEQNDCIGRDKASNDELAEAPESAHVKRTAQEDFEPEAFTVRRSMPWRDARGAGLVFVSFSARLDPFEAQLNRMVGADDGTVDALFRFTRPVTSATFWCPPARGGRLDLSALG